MSFLFIIIFLIGLFFYVKYADPKNYEALTNNNMKRCPDLLIQKGSRYYLHNSKLAQVPGVNPIEFDNLEDYTEFLDWQRSQGIRCPVLFLQESYDAQGNRVYKTRPSVSEPQAGLPPSINTPPIHPNPTLLVDATHDDPPYNTNSFPAYDASPYYIGTTTPLDAMNDVQEKTAVSPDPMDPNWGGAEYTQSLVDNGYYQSNDVNIYVP
jgi:hypothetical protein